MVGESVLDIVCAGLLVYMRLLLYMTLSFKGCQQRKKVFCPSKII